MAVGEYFIENQVVKLRSRFDSRVLKEPRTVYEVIRVIGGVPLFWEDHIERLRGSLRTIGREFFFDVQELESGVKELLRSNGTMNGNLQLLLPGISSGVYVSEIKSKYPEIEAYEFGVDVGLLNAERKQPSAKVVKTKLREDSDSLLREKGWYELLLVNNEGFITEGSRSNVFFLKDNHIVTTPIEYVLGGITRKYVIEACKRSGFEFKEALVCKKDLDSFDAVFLTGTSPKVLPIKTIDCIGYSWRRTELKKIMQVYDRLLHTYIVDNKYRWII